MSSDFSCALLALAVVVGGNVALDVHMRHTGLRSLNYERTAVASVLGMSLAALPGVSTAYAAARMPLPGSVQVPWTVPVSAPAPASEPLTLTQAARSPGAGVPESAAAQRRELRRPVLRVCADPNNLPFSNRRGEGFENAIARLVAQDLGKTVRYTWWPERRGFIRNTLNAGRCDVVMSVPASYELAQPTAPYYRSTYVFVTRRDRGLRITSFDDARLRRFVIGLPGTGNDLTPAAQALASRGLIGRTRIYSLLGDYSKPDPPRALIDAVARSEVDIAIAWGPLAGYFAKRELVALDLAPVTAPANLPYLRMSFPISMGVRHGDTALETALDRALARKREVIHRVLASYGVPLLPVDGAPRVASRSTG